MTRTPDDDGWFALVVRCDQPAIVTSWESAQTVLRAHRQHSRATCETLHAALLFHEQVTRPGDGEGLQ